MMSSNFETQPTSQNTDRKNDPFGQFGNYYTTNAPSLPIQQPERRDASSMSPVSNPFDAYGGEQAQYSGPPQQPQQSQVMSSNHLHTQYQMGMNINHQQPSNSHALNPHQQNQNANNMSVQTPAPASPYFTASNGPDRFQEEPPNMQINQMGTQNSGSGSNYASPSYTPSTGNQQVPPLNLEQYQHSSYQQPASPSRHVSPLRHASPSRHVSPLRHASPSRHASPPPLRQQASPVYHQQQQLSPSRHTSPTPSRQPASPVYQQQQFSPSRHASPIPSRQQASPVSWSQPTHQRPTSPSAIGPDAMVTSNAPKHDPFGVFSDTQKPNAPQGSNNVMPGSNPSPISYDTFSGNYASQQAPYPVAQMAPAQAPVQAPEQDMWAEMFGAPAPGIAPAKDTSVKLQLGPDGLPVDGVRYEARCNLPTLGAVFFKANELTTSLYCKASNELIEALGDRPVVAFTFKNSAAEIAGAGVGHVLLKVNGVDVECPHHVSLLVRESPRPLSLSFYIPPTKIILSEGQYMVKYDSKDLIAPSSNFDWKPKYVAVGGIVAKPFVMNMYRSKLEYDKAVIEIQTGLKVSVKVKQFSLQGARIFKDDNEPRGVKYPNQRMPWRYIVIIPAEGLPIKIAASDLDQLQIIHETIRKTIKAQQIEAAKIMEEDKMELRDSAPPQFNSGCGIAMPEDCGMMAMASSPWFART